MRLTDRPTWKALDKHARDLRDVRILDLFAGDPERSTSFSIEACGLLFDYSKNPLTAETRQLLVAAAEDASVPAQVAAMFEGRKINVTEKRAVLHTALRNRSDLPLFLMAREVIIGGKQDRIIGKNTIVAARS